MHREVASTPRHPHPDLPHRPSHIKSYLARSEQTSRLYSSGYARIFFILEGDLRSPQFPYASLLGAALNAELRPRSHVLRSLDLDETAAIVIALCKKAGSTSGIPTGLAPPIVPTSKRKRDADARTVLIRQLMCLPSISEHCARALTDHFGNLPALLEALNDPRTFPRVRLSDRANLGKRRVEILTEYLLPDGSGPSKKVRVYVFVHLWCMCIWAFALLTLPSSIF